MTSAISGFLKIIGFAMGGCIFGMLNAVIYGPMAGKNGINGRNYRQFCMKFGVAFSGGILFLLCGRYFGYGACGMLSFKGLLAFIYLGILAMTALTDWNTGIIHNFFHIGIGLLGVASLWLFPERGIMERLIGIVAASAPMLLLALIREGAFGGGDIKLMAVSGFLLGWKAVLTAMFIGLLSGGIFCVWMLAQKKISFRDSFALGPFLALGLGTALFWGDYLAQWYYLI